MREREIEKERKEKNRELSRLHARSLARSLECPRTSIHCRRRRHFVGLIGEDAGEGEKKREREREEKKGDVAQKRDLVRPIASFPLFFSSSFSFSLSPCFHQKYSPYQIFARVCGRAHGVFSVEQLGGEVDAVAG